MQTRVRGERGAAASEYIAMVLVAALVVGAVYAAGGGRLDQRVRETLCRAVNAILQQESACSAASDPKTDSDFKPQVCKVSDTSTKASVAVKVAFIKIGENIGLTRTVYSDGSVKVTMTNGGELGATGGFGAEARVADAFQAGATVDLGGGVKFASGSSWTFDSLEEAERMEGQLNEYLVMQQADRNAAMTGGLPPSLFHDVEPPKDPSESIVEVAGQGTINGYLGIALDAPLDGGKYYERPALDGEGNGSAEAKWVVREGADGSTTYTTDVGYSGDISGTLMAQDVGKQGKASGAVSVKVKDGQIIGVTLTHVVDDAGYAKPGVDHKVSEENGEVDSKTGKPKRDHARGSGLLTFEEGRSTVVTTELTLDPRDGAVYDEQVATVRGWLGGNGDSLNPIGAVTAQGIDLTAPGQRNPFEQLLYEKARSSVVEYDTSTKGGEFAAEVKVGLALGISAEFSETQSKATEATYLGAPTTEGRPSIDLTECVAK